MLASTGIHSEENSSLMKSFKDLLLKCKYFFSGKKSNNKDLASSFEVVNIKQWFSQRRYTMTLNSNACTNKPEFKPGNKPYLLFGREVLNNNIPWSEVLEDVLSQPDMTISKVASYLGTSINHLKTVVNGNNCPLSFKQGARLLSLSKFA